MERGFTVVTCGNCHLTYVNPRLAKGELRKLYEDYYHQPQHWERYLAEHQQQLVGLKVCGTGQAMWEARYTHLWTWIQACLDRDPNDLSTLDIGAGSSRWPTWIAERGADSWAFDIAPNCSSERTDSGVAWRVAPSLTAAELPKNHYQLVSMWDVLEHLDTPGPDLAQAADLLADDGLLFIQTPNASWIRTKARLARFIPSVLLRQLIHSYGLMLPEQHLQYYALNTLKRQLQAVGLELVSHHVIDWAEPGRLRLSRWLYQSVYMQAKAVHALSAGRWCSNISLSVLARKSRNPGGG
jgi:2-polyprenyl-3-methyl-5-hydroxy-6-metoxy-1,4-benzoquinol methylase